jgi:putative membrane protein insertion efficiency factor
MSEFRPSVLVAAPSAVGRTWLVSLPARVLSGLIWVYQRTLSPALVVLNPTCGCRFAPTCSHYARGALQEHGFLAGVALTVVRLAKCGPWHPGGEDPVPPRQRPVCVKISSSS